MCLKIWHIHHKIAENVENVKILPFTVDVKQKRGETGKKDFLKFFCPRKILLASIIIKNTNFQKSKLAAPIIICFPSMIRADCMNSNQEQIMIISHANFLWLSFDYWLCNFWQKFTYLKGRTVPIHWQNIHFFQHKKPQQSIPFLYPVKSANCSVNVLWLP